MANELIMNDNAIIIFPTNRNKSKLSKSKKFATNTTTIKLIK